MDIQRIYFDRGYVCIYIYSDEIDEDKVWGCAFWFFVRPLLMEITGETVAVLLCQTLI